MFLCSTFCIVQCQKALKCLESRKHFIMQNFGFFFCRCFSVEDRRHPCVCSLRVCLDWFPCALKYCKNREGEGEHRCGIRTCRKCLTFRYPIKAKNLCMWDEV